MVSERERERPSIARFVNRIAGVMAFLAAIIAVGIGLVMLVDVVRRLVTGRSIPGSFELVESLVTCIVFLGLAQAERAGANVRVTLVTDNVPQKAAVVLRSVGGIVMVAITAWFAYATWIAGLDSFRTGEFSDGIVHFPLWPARFVVALGFTALLLVVLANFKDQVLGRNNQSALDGQGVAL